MSQKYEIQMDDPRSEYAEEEFVRCPACKGDKKCKVSGRKEFDCPLCKGEGEIAFNELMEYIVETLCLHTAQIGD